MTKIIFLAMGLTAAMTAINSWADDSDPTAAPGSKLKVESIRVEGSQGAIEEERVQAMRSEIRFVPTGSDDGYNLVGSSNSQGKSQNAHQNNDMLIPSWKLFSW